MKLTSRMTRRQLAQVVAAHYGYTGRVGGWIYSPDGRPVAHGWDAFADRLGSRIVVGRGVDWQRLTVAGLPR